MKTQTYSCIRTQSVSRGQRVAICQSTTLIVQLNNHVVDQSNVGRESHNCNCITYVTVLKVRMSLRCVYRFAKSYVIKYQVCTESLCLTDDRDRVDIGVVPEKIFNTKLSASRRVWTPLCTVHVRYTRKRSSYEYHLRIFLDSYARLRLTEFMLFCVKT